MCICICRDGVLTLNAVVDLVTSPAFGLHYTEDHAEVLRDTVLRTIDVVGGAPAHKWVIPGSQGTPT